MDLTIEYIKMCDCKIIQDEMWKLILNHKYTDTSDKDYVIRQDINNFDVVIFRDGEVDRRISLPRQDQIQEMLSDDRIFLIRGLSRFLDKTLAGERGMIGMKMPSMEQLWLAFYMYEKHNKVWNGEKWILLKE
jgi:hypothetical protein